VKKVLAEKDPVLYKLSDLMHEDLPGFYYKEQLTVTSEPKEDRLFEVEEVLKTKSVKKKKWFYCKFLFYPSKFNLWIPEENMVSSDDVP